LVLAETDKDALEKFALELSSTDAWPDHLSYCKPSSSSSPEEIKKSLLHYFRWSKGAKTCAALLASCSLSEMPATIKSNLSSMSMLC